MRRYPLPLLMLHEFLASNYHTLVSRCRAKVATRTVPWPSDAELLHGIPVFLEELITALRIEETFTAPELREMSKGNRPANTAVDAQTRSAAAEHRAGLLLDGFTVDQVVHDHGDLCQAIIGLALEEGVDVATDELRTLNRCLDNAVADAVTAFGRRREELITAAGNPALGERLGVVAHELRNLLDTAMLAVAAMKRGHVGMGGATGAVLDRSFGGLRGVIDRSLPEVRLAAGLRTHPERIGMADFIADVQVTGQLEADARRCALTVLPVARGLAVDADRQMLSSAVANLLQNAFAYGGPNGHVWLRAYAAADRALIDVEDECEGLPDGIADALLSPIGQHDAGRGGLGPGLRIAQRVAEASGGTLAARHVPGTGCIFTIELPLAAGRG